MTLETIQSTLIPGSHYSFNTEAKAQSAAKALNESSRIGGAPQAGPGRIVTRYLVERRAPKRLRQWHVVERWTYAPTMERPDLDGVEFGGGGFNFRELAKTV